jgi:micrococcal nuclease
MRRLLMNSSTDKLYHYNATVSRVVDGDTIDVILNLGFDITLKGRIRFHGMNAPESRTRDPEEKMRGLESKIYVEKWVEGHDQKVIIQTSLDKRGKFGRILGRILCPDDKCDCLNDDMIKYGYAEPYDGGSR